MDFSSSQTQLVLKILVLEKLKTPSNWAVDTSIPDRMVDNQNNFS